VNRHIAFATLDQVSATVVLMTGRELNHLLTELGRRQHGVVSRGQLIELGFSPRAISRLVENSWLRVVHPGVYALGPQPLSRTGRELAALLAIGPDPLLSYSSAASRQDLMTAPAIVHVSISTRVERQLRGAVVHRPRRIDPEDRIRIDGLPVTSVPRTLLDLGLILPVSRLEKVVEAADRKGVLDLGAIGDVIDRYAGHRGRKPLKRIFGSFLSTPGANEGIEREFQMFLQEFGFPTPQTNVVVEGLIVDCWWPEARFVVELDSKKWHRSWHAHERDRKRDAILLRAGIRYLRITHHRLHNERLEVAGDLSAGLRLPTPGLD
jgi:very-short-patch-repair endonuclease